MRRDRLAICVLFLVGSLCSLGEDPHGYRAEFLRLVSLASDL
jgi:hypothetical protein